MLKEYAKKISLSLPLHHMFIELFAPMAHATTDGYSLSHTKNNNNNNKNQFFMSFWLSGVCLFHSLIYINMA